MFDQCPQNRFRMKKRSSVLRKIIYKCYIFLGGRKYSSLFIVNGRTLFLWMKWDLCKSQVWMRGDEIREMW